MKFNSVFTFITSVAVGQAHSTIYNILVNDIDQGLGNSAAGYIRTPPNNNPVKDITSTDMICNVNNVATAKTIDVAGGDKITFQWHHNSADASDDIIDPVRLNCYTTLLMLNVYLSSLVSQGPALVYIAPIFSNGAGDVWVKLAESGYDSAAQIWAVDTLIADKGQHSITLTDLAAGTYLLRPEIIALHEADAAYNVNPARGAQFYMECVQIKITSRGTKSLPSGVTIPGVYKYTDPGVVFNLYGLFTSYPIPGPAVWDGVSGTSPAPTTKAATTTAGATTKTIVPTTSAVVKPTASTSVAGSASSATVQISATVTTPVVITSSTPTTLITLTKPATSSTTMLAASSSTPVITGTVSLYYQCGGINYSGATSCVAGAMCKVQNPYYSQCIAA